MKTTQDTCMVNNRETGLARVTQQLNQIERRDWELWGIVSLTGLIVSGTLLVILFWAAFTDGIHFELTVSRPLAVGLLVLLIVANTYFVTKRFEVRRLRQQIISMALQNRMIEQQSFTDPLTEVYNRRSLEEIAGRFMSHARRRKAPLTFLMI